jgi:hypothetical protein
VEVYSQLVAALPLSVQEVLPVLATDQGRYRGDTLIAIVVLGPDKLQVHLDDVHRALGTYSPGRGVLQELVHIASRAMSPLQPTVPTQHVTSKIVLRQWVEPLPPAGNVVARFSLAQGKYLNPVGLKTLGSVKNFVAIDSKATEELWQGVENLLPGELRIASTFPVSSILDLGLLKRGVALHLVRHPQTLIIHQRSTTLALQDQLERLSDTPLAAEAFRQHHHGLYSAGPEARRIGVTAAQTRFRQLEEDGVLFRLSVQRLFEAVCDRFDPKGLALLSPANGNKEFVIGDVPAFTYNRNTGLAGLAAGVAVDVADEIVMPLGPRLLAVVGRPNAVQTITDNEVDRFNELQVHVANEFIYHRPTVDFSASIARWLATPTGQAGAA